MSMVAPLAPIILLGALLAVSALLATAAGVFRVQSLREKSPLQPQWALPLTIAMICGFLTWIAAQAGYGTYLQARSGSKSISEGDFTSMDWAILATAPPLLGFATLLIGDCLAGSHALAQRLGVNLRKFPRGVLYGLLGSVIVLPAVYVVSMLTNVLYERIHFPHPEEHELLLAMKNSSRALRIVLILAATVAAPLWEELLFRAHLQTLLGFAMARTRQSSEAPSSTSIPAALEAPAVLEYMHPQATSQAARPVWQIWVAILLASTLFAMVHPRWTWPPIFCLAIGLGYAYERTGNLWASITMHCLFNLISTTLYLGVLH